MLTLVLVSLVAVLSAVLVFSLKKRYSYWKDRGVPYIEPKFLKGNLDGVGRDCHIGELMQQFYLKHKHTKKPFIGGYMLTQPMAIITDLDLAKDIMIKDFKNFPDRPTYYNEKDDPLSAHLFTIDGQKWRDKRSKLTPTFTTGKMRTMAPLMLDVAKKLELEVLSRVEETGGTRDLELKDILGRFTTDVIGSCVFGFECNSLKNKDVDFRRNAMHIFDKPRHSSLIRLLLAIYPDIGRLMRIRNTSDNTSSFFLKIVNEAVKFREKTNFHRNDFLDLLISLKNSPSSALTMNEISAEAFLFFAAGFETSSSAMGFALYELAFAPEIQEKARAEIKEVLSKHNDEFTYDTIKEMTYVDQVIKETLRKYPVLPVLMRVTRNDYKVEGTPYTIEKGVFINIPAYGYHKDPEIWSDPEKFNPSRFEKEQADNRHPAAYIPFGIGPRNCIGMRFGKLQANAGLAVLLRSFRFSVCSQTKTSLKFLTDSITLCTDSGIWLKVEKVED